jgi:hypothetical protein
MGIFDGFADAFTPAYQNSLARWQQQQNADREFALQKERHDADMKERGLRTSQLQAENDASSALTEGYTRGISRNTGLGMATEPEYDASAVQYKPATERELLGLQERLAAAKRDIGGLGQIREKKRSLDIEDSGRANIERMASDPKYLSEAVRNINSQHSSITVDEGLDPKTGKQLRAARITYVKPDGSAGSFEPTGAQRKTLAFALAHIDHGDSKTGLEMLSKLDKDLADVASKGMAEQTGVFNANSAAQDRWQNQEYRQAMLKNDGARLGIARQQLDASNWVPEQYVDKDGKVRIFDVNRKGAQPQFRERAMPEGLKPYAQRDPLMHAQLVKYYTDAGMPMAQAMATADARLGGEDPTKRVLEALQKLNDERGKAQGAPQSKQAPRPPEDRIGNGPIGLLTPRSHIEEAARLGNPAAKRALDTLHQNDIDTDMMRQGLYPQR